MPGDNLKICVVGSINVDLTFVAPEFPRAGETRIGRSFRIGFGGKGANQAVMAARLGARVTMIAKVGQDIFGGDALRNLNDLGVETNHVGTAPHTPTGTAAILVDATGQNRIIIVPGANEALSIADVRAAAPAIRSAPLLLGQLETPIEATEEAFRIARAAGVRTVLNPAPARPLSDELLGLTDFCVPNESEAAELTGISVRTVDDAVATGRALLQRGVRTVIITLGERGALWVDRERAEHVAAKPVNAVDTSGGGDAFIGSFAVSLGQRLSLPEAIRRANLVAGLSVQRMGTQASFPDHTEVERHWRRSSAPS